MKKFLPSPLLPILFLFATSIVYAQNDRFAYAVTDTKKDGVSWSTLRRVDLETGTFSDVLLNGTDASRPVFDAVTRKQLPAATDARLGSIVNMAFGNGVAAIAYDKRNQRLYYTPMFIDQLRYVDLKTMQVFFINASGLMGHSTRAGDQSDIITRMAIASNGRGYALTNDGEHLIEFTTGKKINITDLGRLSDDAQNKSISVHNSCSSYGGDMIADDEGNLILFSARNHVFRINIETKLATHLGGVTGLPANFTINGAVVDASNAILVSSATDNSALYRLDIKNWNASPATDGSWRSSDLANSNLLATTKAPLPELLKNIEETGEGNIRLYPNPVVNDRFTLQFNLPAGGYTVQLTDAVGRMALQSALSLKAKGQTQDIAVPSAMQKGFYLVKVVDQHNKTVFTKKVLVQ